MKIAVYAICKNEEKFVKRFLDSCKDADGIFILDTGSTDATALAVSNWVAGNLPERCAQVSWHSRAFSPWRFDVARNASLDVKSAFSAIK